MAILEGATFHGYFSELTVVNQLKPSKTGAAAAKYNSATVIQASVEKNTAKIAAHITPYSQALSLLFGTENF